MVFIRSAVRPADDPDPAYYFCFLGEDVLLQRVGWDGEFPLWTSEQAKKFGIEDRCFIGSLNGKPCYAVVKTEKIISDEYQWTGLRDLYLNGESELADAAGYARQIGDWNVNFYFCGRCASPTVVLPNEHARQCVKCRLINYPRISPAVITAVIKDDQILLARGRNYRDKEMFSVLAGFVEPGESLEDTVRREIREEVGIEVTDLQYVKSHSWPFPDSLMIGFMARYRNGQIKIDETEIIEAGWFKADALPKVPARRSLASELIRWFVVSNIK